MAGGKELFAVFGEGGGVDVHRGLVALYDLFFGEVVELDQSAVVAAEADEPLAFRAFGSGLNGALRAALGTRAGSP